MATNPLLPLSLTGRVYESRLACDGFAQKSIWWNDGMPVPGQPLRELAALTMLSRSLPPGNKADHSAGRATRRGPGSTQRGTGAQLSETLSHPQQGARPGSEAVLDSSDQSSHQVNATE